VVLAAYQCVPDAAFQQTNFLCGGWHNQLLRQKPLRPYVQKVLSFEPEAHQPLAEL